jgi:hypothetical protein
MTGSQQLDLMSARISESITFLNREEGGENGEGAFAA